jgi:D-3-phosphoglycerate dehydrogenase
VSVLVKRRFSTLITADLELSFLEKIRHRLEIEVDGYGLNRRILSPEQMAERCRSTEILITEYEIIDRTVIEGAPKLKLISCCRGGVGTAVDVGIATERGIVVAYTPGRNANAVSDFTMGLLLDLSRNIARTHTLIKGRHITAHKSSAPSFYRDTIWGLDENSPFVLYRGTSLRNKTLGIVGFGRIGRSLAKKSAAFGLNILIHDPYLPDNGYGEHGERKVELNALLRESDFISLHCALTEETRDLISRQQLDMMKPTAYLINTARGALINEEDLCLALRSGVIAGAALDVVKTEPIPPDSPLLEFDNLILTPHLAGASDEVRNTTSEMTARNIEDFLEGKKPPYTANPELYTQT